MTQDNDHARDNASAWMDTIASYIAAFDCDYDQLEALREQKNKAEDGEAADLTEEEAKELADLEDQAGDYESQEQAETEARESILDLQVRADWHAPGDKEGNKPTEFFILLSTGGPALRIMGELDRYNEPSRAWLEYQDWGAPWTEYHGENADHDALIRFASLFYYGE